MPTQRPFLGNFLAAFRAHSQPLPKAAASISPSAAIASSASIWTAAPQTSSKLPVASQASETSVASPKPINAKSNPYNTTSSGAQDWQVHSLSPLQHNVSPQTHLPRSPSSSGLTGSPTYPTCQEVGRPRARRGSDSSSDSGGFRETRNLSGETWFVGGRTAGGEERYYKLSMVKRDRSADRISTDQLSL